MAKTSAGTLERACCAALARVPGLSPRKMKRIIDSGVSLAELWSGALPLPWRDDVLSSALAEARSRVDPAAELARLEDAGVAVLTILDDAYPSLLKTIYDPPAVLYCEGRLEERDALAVAIVGTRRPTATGREVAFSLARDLAAGGVTVVSGLALGIDASAHQGALAGGGRTIAVLGCSLDFDYPKANRELRRSIAERGAAITEFPPGTEPAKWHFPARNRIISGLSKGTLVVEAGEKSGALITADFALHENREVFAVPGSIRSPVSVGTNALIRDGARLVSCVQDIFEELRIPSPMSGAPDHQLTLEEGQIIALLDDEGKLVDHLVRDAALPPARVSALLVRLETLGLVRRMPGNVYVRVHESPT